MKLVAGVGINDSETKINKKVKLNGKWMEVWRCPYYSIWSSMLRRVYSPTNTYQKRNYRDCTVCEEWKIFSNFRKWLILNKWEEGFCIDKDILSFKLPTKVYSPDTCCLVSTKVNQFLTSNRFSRGAYPLGVNSEYKNSYYARISSGIGNEVTRLGTYPTPEEAHRAWQLAKIQKGLTLAEEQENIRVRLGILNVVYLIQKDYSLGKITEY